MKSLRDQLLKTGLTDNQSVKNARKQKKHEQQQQNKKPKNQRGQLSETAKQLERKRLEKVHKDQELNRQQQLERERKAVRAQIVQLIEHSKIESVETDLSYNFTLNGKVKNLWVTPQQKQLLIRGKIAIAALSDTQFALVPKTVAEKIALRDANIIIQNTIEDIESSEDDPYADYQIPDDLQW
jgi:uncharacterized protein YaiL (DUF2058 family)